MKPIDPIPYDRASTRGAEAAVASRMASAFAPIAKQLVGRIRLAALTAKMVKTADDNAAKRAAEITDGLDLGGIADQAKGVAEDVKPVIDETVKAVGVQVGVDMPNDRAAKAVGEKLAPSIAGLSETTRAMLRDQIAAGLRNNIGLDAIADEIEGAYALSKDRAETIAATEVSRANSTATLESYKAAADAGVTVLKTWLAEADCCDECSGNEAAGPIALDQDFPSSHAAPPAHPRCRCALSPVVREADEMDDATKGRFVAEKDGALKPYPHQQSTLSSYHAEAERLQKMKADLETVADSLRSMDTLAKAGGDEPTVRVDVALETTIEAIAKIDAIMAMPMPAPWELQFAAMPTAGSA